MYLKVFNDDDGPSTSVLMTSYQFSKDMLTSLMRQGSAEYVMNERYNFKIIKKVHGNIV